MIIFRLAIVKVWVEATNKRAFSQLDGIGTSDTLYRRQMFFDEIVRSSLSPPQSCQLYRLKPVNHSPHNFSANEFLPR